jgi:hypothetical protein
MRVTEAGAVDPPLARRADLRERVEVRAHALCIDTHGGQ